MEDDRPSEADGASDPSATTDSQRRREREAQRIRELVAFQEGALDVPVLGEAGIRALLGSRPRPRIAMIGASSNPARPSNDVFRYMVAAGYDVVPISPTEADVEGSRAYSTLAEAVAATGPFDIADVFRRAEFCPDHAREAVEAGVGCLWLQLGIVSAEAARIAADAGISVVMDRCIKIEAARLEG
jgi:predicted CoA-binding protein